MLRGKSLVIGSVLLKDGNVLFDSAGPPQSIFGHNISRSTIFDYNTVFRHGWTPENVAQKNNGESWAIRDKCPAENDYAKKWDAERGPQPRRK
ncbi:hypothetical protein LMH87_009531 [Akanthomyces muscarius]|uniref:Uncharacterized protein n=1 Tax=Akanthomyces muscarius TaxID=2231603 RepID=A0A9W8QEV7_AKAMU|nr:hypothetical protein LMH87_009531 [Akanthomyces muscarius]KAJ4153019.1 hypothetical protein LMH87_009531 [Akanthomyces muscarius]